MSFSPGEVSVCVRTAQQGLADVAVSCERPHGMGALLARYPVAEIPNLTGRLFALCGVSQASAALYALGEAQGRSAIIDEDGIRRLAAERLAEHLRSCFIGWGTFVAASAQEAEAVRKALAALRALIIAPGDLPSLILLDTQLAVLGLLAGQSVLSLPTGSWASRLLARAASEHSFPALAIDPLSADDDAAVIAALEAGGEFFAARPELPGRSPETGSMARLALRGLSLPDEGLSGRMAARLFEMGEALEIVLGNAPQTPWIVSGRLDGGGWAAVETPRGRLHHAVWLDGEGKPVRYLILAPTEWNFSPHGPYARMAANARFASSIEIKDAMARLAALCDPCIACHITVQEDADA